MKRPETSTRLENKIAVITGGCSGIGLATVELFLAAGARVFVGDMQDDKGSELQARCGDRLRYRHCDVTKEDDIRSLMDWAGATGGFDVLFNNAGAAGSPARIDEIDGDAWDRTHSLLLRSVALGMRYAVPHMKARGGGSIINTSSIAALTSGAAPVAYSTAKAGVLHLSKVAAAQLAQFHIRVNAICPGFVLTSIFAGGLKSFGFSEDQVRDALQVVAPTLQPIAKTGMPQYIANAVLYFASDESVFTTGTHLVIDGGSTVGPRHSWDPSEPTLGAILQAQINKSQQK